LAISKEISQNVAIFFENFPKSSVDQVAWQFLFIKMAKWQIFTTNKITGFQ